MSKRLGELDILRAAAVLLVLGRHLNPIPESLVSPARILLAGWQKIGWVGVDLFFVLSGFLVSGLIFREFQHFGHVSVGHFLVRRGLKIYPAFYVFLSISILVTFWLGELTWKWPVFCEAAFIQNYGPAIWNHTWSLAVEEHFYIFLPLLLAALVRVRRNADDPFADLPWIFISMGVILLALRIGMSIYVEYGNKSHMYPTHLRIDSLMFGVLLSYFFHFYHDHVTRLARRSAPFAIPLAAICVASGLFFEVSDVFMHTFGFALMYLGFGILLLILLAWESGTKDRAMRWVAGISVVGVYSYSIYLWHMPMQRWGIRWLRHVNGGELGFYAESAIYVIGSIVVGIAMAKLVEMPVLRLRDRWYPSRSGAITSKSQKDLPIDMSEIRVAGLGTGD